VENPAAYEWIFRVFAFVLGAAIGSFLNVCIYRLPLDLSVNEPKRSFCPSCKKEIPWTQNLPLLSWLFLRGKCANCKAPISPRYLFVELLTGVMFLWAFLYIGWDWKVLAAWVFLALAIVSLVSGMMRGGRRSVL
jgi:leader peptidase (prepilin peptidase)/N-methyltransferase